MIAISSNMGTTRVSAWSFYAIFMFCFSLQQVVGLRASIVAGNETDQAALLEFKSKITYDPLGVLASWNRSIHFCQWHGVTCTTPMQRRVTILDLQSLQLAGSISPYIGNLSFLAELNLQNNQLTGTIPPAVGHLQNLESLYLNRNKLSGYIPFSIGYLKILIHLDLSDNFLQGTIPSSFGQCKNLVAVDLSNNNLIGTLSLQFVGLFSLSLLDISRNLLSGEISNSLGRCTSLEQLDMHGNLFEGPIRSSLSYLRGLRSLDFSQNNLSGEIPEFLSEFELLQNLNLSYNNFEGMMPTKGIFEDASATSILGNNKLCGGMSEFQLPTCSSKETERKRSTLPLILVISIDSGLLILTLALTSLLSYLVWKSKRGNPIPSISTDFLSLSYGNLYNATNGFSSANLIGVGNFGSVYKGILFEGGATIAVKVFNLLHEGGSKSFIAECKAMRNIRHRNLVNIVTACCGLDYQGNDFKALIYKFMPNGSLEEWLHGEDEAQRGPMNLNLLKRLNIAIDVACALNYLHLHCKPPIAHCDIKPSNVLLDDEMTAHVADFGIARFLQSTDDQQTSSSVNLTGSIGYIAPEYGLGSKVSSYGDVYSFGILLLEMFTGIRPTADIPLHDMSLQNFVRSALPEQAEKIVDIAFLQEIEEEETLMHMTACSGQSSIILECLIAICEIGLACSAEQPWLRIDINEAESGLRLVKMELVKRTIYEDKQTISAPFQGEVIRLSFI